jgi:hypothetical protein
MGAFLHIRRSFPFYVGKENPFLLPVSLSSSLAAVAEISVDEDEQRRADRRGDGKVAPIARDWDCSRVTELESRLMLTSSSS